MKVITKDTDYAINALTCITASGGKTVSVKELAEELGISIEEATAKAYAELIKDIPLGRVAQPEEQAHAVAFLASSESDFITGVALNVNGGRVMVP